MIVTVFRSRLRPGVREEYVALVEKIAAIAKTMPGYISHKGFLSDDGERCTIVEFESEETHRGWAEHPEHREAQKLGRQKFYLEYSIHICKAVRSNSFKRADSSPQRS